MSSTMRNSVKLNYKVDNQENKQIYSFHFFKIY